ncbi:MAG: hypothetical protein P4L79_11465 [Legionella sp.]|uniref:hypothetical protein n=1 Tax=Legionella sp. TaxID=459 RepID=UPI002845B476|nr:hypothetical protein [Legionella sp.]
MNPSIFHSGRDALILVLKNKNQAQSLAPKTLYRLALSGAPSLQSDALDVLFKQSTAEARTFQRFVLTSWIKHPENTLIPEDDKLHDYLPTLAEPERLFMLVLMAKRKKLSYPIQDSYTISYWHFPWTNQHQHKKLFNALAGEVQLLAKDAMESDELQENRRIHYFGNMIDFLYFKENAQFLSLITTTLKNTPLLLSTCSLQNLYALINLLSDEDKFAILDELLSLPFLRDANLRSYKAYKKFDLSLLDNVLSLFLESMSVEKRTLCFNKHAAYFLNNYAEKDRNWKPFPNQFIIAALPYLDKVSINQFTDNFLSYFKKGVKLSNKHAELGLRLMPYLDKPSLEFLASHYLCPGSLSRQQRHRAWAFLSVRVLPQCFDLVDAWIKKKGFKDCLDNFFLDFRIPLPEPKKLTYLQQFYDGILKHKEVVPLEETEAYARLLSLWSVPHNETNQKMVSEGLKKILFTPSAADDVLLRPEARFICEAFCTATTPITPLPMPLVELLKEYGLDMDESLTPFLVLPTPYELLQTVSLTERRTLLNMLQAWDQLVHNYLHNEETAKEAIRPLLEWVDASNNYPQHLNQDLLYISQKACQLGLSLLSSCLLSCSLQQLHLMQQLLDAGLSFHTYPSKAYHRNYNEINKLYCLSWIAITRQDCMQPESKSWCTIL